ncbi:hypothetical protein OG749_15025 [Streptomyces nojiriensis]|uniref:hypothetical protein n=1 Tax=Streptomyces nojiriensis TaxID=66374 RepID=UPI002E16D229
MEGDLLGGRRAAAAVFDGPAEAGPAVGRHVALPGEAFGEGLVLAAGAAAAPQAGEPAGEVGP